MHNESCGTSFTYSGYGNKRSKLIRYTCMLEFIALFVKTAIQLEVTKREGK